MQYAVGDTVVHPTGAGTIIDTRHLKLVDGLEHYFVIEIPTRDSTVFVPMRKMDEVGIRPVMSRDRLARVFDTLRGEAQPLPHDYKKRQAEVAEKLASGRPLQIAEVIRDLSWREQVAHLTGKDTRLLDQGRQFLAGEVALLTGAELDDVGEMIDEALAKAIPGEPE
jgi:CarD family transcriptional regulator